MGAVSIMQPDCDVQDILLRRHFRSVAGRCRMQPDVPLGRTRCGCIWPGVAVHLRWLAPR